MKPLKAPSLAVSQSCIFSVVFIHVCLEVALLSGAVGTEGTSKWFFSSMGSEVVHKIGWGYGEIAAVGAFKFLDEISPRSDVTLWLLIPNCTLGATTHHSKPPSAVLLLQVHHQGLLKDAQLSKYVYRNSSQFTKCTPSTSLAKSTQLFSFVDSLSEAKTTYS